MFKKIKTIIKTVAKKITTAVKNHFSRNRTKYIVLASVSYCVFFVILGVLSNVVGPFKLDPADPRYIGSLPYARWFGLA